jgi:hypothetical protein
MLLTESSPSESAPDAAPKLANEAKAREIARVPLGLRWHVLRLAIELAKGGELSAMFIRLAAAELGVEDGTPMLPRNGDGQIQTPDALARADVEHFLPCGRVVEPSSGNGAFLRAIPNGADWFEIQKGRYFLKAEGRRDWPVGNTPFSQFHAFHQRAMQVADNLVFIGLDNPFWCRSAARAYWTEGRYDFYGVQFRPASVSAMSQIIWAEPACG